MKIYFAGSIRGGREDQARYEAILAMLREYGEVLTEHVADAGLSDQGEESTDRSIHDRDMKWLMEAQAVVAEVTTPSLGVGYEIGRAVDAGKPVLCLFREDSGRVLSAMIAGCPQVQVVQYRTADTLCELLRAFFKVLV